MTKAKGPTKASKTKVTKSAKPSVIVNWFQANDRWNILDK